MLDNLFSGKNEIRREGTGGEETTGLGMFVVNKYIRLLYDIIDVDSEPGRGTIFRILIPKTLTNG
jgi:signal transduction histidine kinase